MRKEAVALAILGLFLFPISVVAIDNQEAGIANTVINEDSSSNIETASITFLENIGQVHDPLVKYYATSKSVSIGFKPGSIVLLASGSEELIELDFVNGNSVEPKGVESLHHPTHLFLGEHGTYTNISSYKGVIYSQAWDGVDLYFDFNKDSLRFSLDAESTSDLEKVHFQTADSIISLYGLELTLNDRSHDGFLNIWLQDEVNLDFKTKIDDSQFTPSEIVDGIIYTSFVSGSDDDDYGRDVALDSEGNAYVVGEAQSDFFYTLNGYDSSVDNIDAFLTKFDGEDGDIIYSTVIGGSEREIGYAVTVDSDGNAYIGGSTTSSNYPLANPYDDIYEDVGEAFLSKFGPNGDTLLFSTYLGGKHYTPPVTLGPGQAIYNLEMAPDNDIILSGFARTPNFPTVGGLYTSLAGETDCFVAKMDTTSSHLVFSTLIGGSDYEIPFDLEVDESGTIYVSGYTKSPNFPFVSGYSDTLRGESDAFFFVLEKNGTQLLHSSYLGGSDSDYGFGVGVDAQGNVYVSGYGSSADFPVTMDGNFSVKGGIDCFITRFNPDCTTVEYSFTFGGNADDRMEGMTVDKRGNVYVTGFTYSTNFLISDATVTPPMSEPEGFVSKLNATGDSIWYSKYIANPGRGVMKDVEIDSSGNATATGYHWPNANARAQVIKIANIGDLDGDGIGDSVEEVYGSNPYRADTDSDLLDDFEELFIYGTDVNNPDTDHDSLIDGIEIQIGTDPFSADSDGDGIIDS
ncbi:MAG: SBBP repeat-containing protein, partial [Candidatus Thorarchaeota archaeon]